MEPTNLTALASRIHRFFNRYHPVHEAFWQHFAARMQRRVFAKNEIVKAAGATEHYLSFITSGAGGVFAWKEGHEVCLDFSVEDQFFGDYASFLQQQPSAVFTLAVEPLELYSIGFSDLQTLYNNTPEGIRAARAAAEALFIESQQRQLDLLTKSAETRYRELFASSPELLLRLPQKHIASWLGITPESLSRIRKSVMEA